MAESIIEQSQRQGETRAKQDAVLKLLQFRFKDIPETVSEKIASIDTLSHLDLLFEKSMTIDTLDEINWQDYND